MARRAYLDLYVAYGSGSSGVVLRGRVLAGLRPSLGESTTHTVTRLRNSVRLLETDEIKGIPVEVSLLTEAGQEVAEYAAISDREGYFSVHIPGPLAEGTHKTRARVLQSGIPGAGPTRLIDLECDSVESFALITGPAAGLAVISDIDDTVLDTGVTSKLKLASGVLLGTPDGMRTFEGAPQLYQRMSQAGMPIVFVSGSPWSLEPRLRAFFKLRGFPLGAMLLKDMGVGPEADPLFAQDSYKARRIAEVMAILPSRRFILIGDSGERDPEIYERACRDFGDRVVAAFIRRVPLRGKDAERIEAQRFSGLTHVRLLDTFAQITQELEKRGLLVPYKPL